MKESEDLNQLLCRREPLLWQNPGQLPAGTALAASNLRLENILEADRRLRRWAPTLATIFPELLSSGGIIDSALTPLPHEREVLQFRCTGRVWLKQDHMLPVAGSIKARGGIHEVLAFADELLQASEMQDAVTPGGLTEAARDLFANHTIAVGSTGNLGLSIGIVASALGFRAQVHMSDVAKAWKKQRLRTRGVEVVEHAGDFATAVAGGRELSRQSHFSYFVDDEWSERLFLGYAVAALHLRQQLQDAQVVVDLEHPLIVYLPCGVGGAPGGITFGLKHVFGDAVHCFLVEPCASPCMLVRLANPDARLSVYDIGLDNLTEADGLAVPMASDLAYGEIRSLISGVMTVLDDDLYRLTYRLKQHADISVEPSSAAGLVGPGMLQGTKEGQQYLAHCGLDVHLKNALHLVWTTGGLFVPKEEQERFHQRGRALERQFNASHPASGRSSSARSSSPDTPASRR